MLLQGTENELPLTMDNIPFLLRCTPSTENELPLTMGNIPFFQGTENGLSFNNGQDPVFE